VERRLFVVSLRGSVLLFGVWGLGFGDRCSVVRCYACGSALHDAAHLIWESHTAEWSEFVWPFGLWASYTYTYTQAQKDYPEPQPQPEPEPEPQPELQTETETGVEQSVHVTNCKFDGYT